MPSHCCRSLAFLSSPLDKIIPHVHGLLELTYLQLSFHNEGVQATSLDMLTSLCHLKDLSIKNPVKPLVISSAVELTRLAIEGDVVSSS